MLDVYAYAADACPGLPWQLVAAIAGTANPELANQLDPETGEVHPARLGPLLDGQGGEPKVSDPAQPSGWARAEGPFSILSALWPRYGTAAPDTGRAVPDPQNAWDSSFTLAHVLCSYLGNENGDPEAALADYDPAHRGTRALTRLLSPTAWPPARALGVAREALRPRPSRPMGGRTRARFATVIAAAGPSSASPMSGWRDPDGALTVSGLVQWAYAQAGIAIPRVTYSQADVGAEVPRPWAGHVAPGDLLLMAGDDNGVTTPLGHIAMAIGGRPHDPRRPTRAP